MLVIVKAFFRQEGSHDLQRITNMLNNKLHTDSHFSDYNHRFHQPILTHLLTENSRSRLNLIRQEHSSCSANITCSDTSIHVKVITKSFSDSISLYFIVYKIPWRQERFCEVLRHRYR